MRRVTTTTWAIVTAVVALIGSGLSVIFQVRPDLLPDPRSKVAATVSIFAVEPDVTLGDWSDRVGSDVTGDPDVRRLLHGDLLYVRTDLSGFKGRSVAIRGSVYDARTRKRRALSDETLTCLISHDLPGVGSGSLLRDIESIRRTLRRTRLREIDSPSRTSVQLLLLPSLRFLQRRVFVRVEVSDEKGLIAVADSPVLAQATRARDALHGSDIGPATLC